MEKVIFLYSCIPVFLKISDFSLQQSGNSLHQSASICISLHQSASVCINLPGRGRWCARRYVLEIVVSRRQIVCTYRLVVIHWVAAQDRLVITSWGGHPQLAHEK
jgi:hypothetical protein